MTVPTIGSSGRSSFFSARLGASVLVGAGGCRSGGGGVNLWAEVTRRHPHAAHHTLGLPVMETAQESKAQGWVSGHNAVEVPQGYLHRGSLSVSPGPPDGPGMCRVDHDVYDLET